ncbi:MAG: hypothetical protein EPN82_02705 [Bacteroidetes bacterium]|nr:MAG: hypothetical protein EPN82_02705 [Bacteroidota bacterium]
MKNILILGGYGNSGKQVVELLLKFTDCNIIIAGRSLEKSKMLSDKLNILFEGNRVFFKSLDAENIDMLTIAFKKIDMVIVCSSTLLYYKNIINTAIEAGIDYFDINISKEKNDYLFSKENIIKDKRLCFITDGGFHPGVPGALVKYASTKYDYIEMANVYGLMKINWKNYSFSKETILEFVKEFQNFNTLTYKNHNWKKLSYSESEKVDFGEDYGKQKFYPMHLDEMNDLPEKLNTLNETGFYVSGFNWFVDYFILPLAVILLKIFGKFALNPVSKMFVFGLKHFSKPPYNIILKLKSEGLKNGRKCFFEMNLINKDAYQMTAIPVAAAIKQYLVRDENTGVWYQSNFVEPLQFIKDMELFGMKIEESNC